MILGIETSTARASLALIKGPEVIIERKITGEVRHSESIFPEVVEMLDHFDFKRNNLRGIAVSIGPGMFTALRVGLALAKGLGLALNVPVIGVNTLDALARSVCTSLPYLLPLIDAGRGDVYLALYRNSSGRPRLLKDYHLIKIEQIDAFLKNKVLIFGPGLEVFNEIIQDKARGRLVCFEHKLLAPSASIIAQIGAEELAQGHYANFEELEPFYIKQPDAVIRRNKKTNRCRY